MDILSSYNLIIGASGIVILSFWFNGISKKTNIPSVLMLIILGVGLQFGLRYVMGGQIDFAKNLRGTLEIIGTVGLIMIVLEAALELKLSREKLMPILKSMAIALIGLILSAWVAALVLYEFIEGMTMQSAWLYATPLSILSSAIIIPSVTGLQDDKKEFHIYESTFSDIMGIMMFYFLTGGLDNTTDLGAVGFAGNVVLTILIAVVASYALVLVFQRIKSQAKQFLLIAVLLLLYAIGKKMHLSSLIIILVFGLVIANVKLFFPGKAKAFLQRKKMKQVYHELHIITMETAFVVRTFFFVIFGITIALTSLLSLNVAMVSLIIIASIYAIRWALLRVFLGKNSLLQVFIAPRGLITILLFYAIPASAEIAGFESGILLFVIIATSLIMTGAMIRNKKKIGTELDELDAKQKDRDAAQEAIAIGSTGNDLIDKLSSKVNSGDVNSAYKRSADVNALYARSTKNSKSGGGGSLNANSTKEVLKSENLLDSNSVGDILNSEQVDDLQAQIAAIVKTAKQEGLSIDHMSTEKKNDFLAALSAVKREAKQ